MVVKIATPLDDAPTALDATIAWLYTSAASLSADALSAALDGRLSEITVGDEKAARAIDWHLKMAQTLCARNDENRAGLGQAEVTLDGSITSMDDAFARFIRQAVPDWRGEKLPFQIFWTDSLPYHGMTFARLFIRVRATDTGYALVVREDQRVSLLSRREQEVARLIADGQTFKQVGEQLGLAISTVSTHLYRVYDKLSIGSRSELVQWMREQSQAVLAEGAQD